MHPIIAAFGHHQSLRAEFVDRGGQNRCEIGAAVATPVRSQCVVPDLVAAFAQIVAMMAHGGKEQHQPLFVAPDVRGLGLVLCHPDHVARRVVIIQRGQAPIELVAEHEHEISNVGQWLL